MQEDVALSVWALWENFLFFHLGIDMKNNTNPLNFKTGREGVCDVLVRAVPRKTLSQPVAEQGLRRQPRDESASCVIFTLIKDTRADGKQAGFSALCEQTM